MRNPLELLTRSALWAIKPEAVWPAVEMLLSRHALVSSGVQVDAWEAAKPTVQTNGATKIAIVPIDGVLTKDGPSWYGSNYDTIGNAVESAAANLDIKRIVLTVDSPGGDVLGLPETAAIIRDASKVKPVSAIITGMAASAAYWLTSQANDITLTPSGEVGSVGVRMMHVDVSKMLDQAGFKVTELFSGNFKTEWSPFKPLSDEAKADMQPRLEAVHHLFLNAVGDARGERAGDKIREARFGEGRMFSASDAMGNGLVDKVQSPRAFYRAILPPVEQETSAPAFPVRARHAVNVAEAGGEV